MRFDELCDDSKKKHNLEKKLEIIAGNMVLTFGKLLQLLLIKSFTFSNFMATIDNQLYQFLDSHFILLGYLAS